MHIAFYHKLVMWVVAVFEQQQKTLLVLAEKKSPLTFSIMKLVKISPQHILLDVHVPSRSSCHQCVYVNLRFNLICRGLI